MFRKWFTILEKLLSPGIRLKLAVFASLLSALIAGGTGYLQYSSARSELVQQMESDTKPVIDALGNMLASQLTLNKALDSVYPFRKKILAEKINGRRLPASEKYFSEDHLQNLEEEIKSGLRDSDGNLLSDGEADLFLNRKVKSTVTRTYTEKQNEWAPISLFGLIPKEKKVTRTYSKTSLIENRREKQKAMSATLASGTEEQLSLLNLDTTRYRLQSFNTRGSLLFDSRNLQKGNYSPVHQIDLSKKEAERKAYRDSWNKAAGSAHFDSSMFQNSPSISEERYATVYSPVFIFPESSRRSMALLEAFSRLRAKNEKLYHDIAGMEKEYIASLRKIQKDIAQERKDKTADKNNREKKIADLYTEYEKTRKKYAIDMSAIFPVEDKDKKKLDVAKRRIEELEARAQEIQKKHSEGKTASGELGEISESVKKQNQKIQSKIAAEKDKANWLQYRIENWNLNQSAFLHDAPLSLHNSFLHDKAALSARHHAGIAERYMLSEEYRKEINQTRSNLRTWIQQGVSESRPLVASGRIAKELEVLLYGILSDSRSNLEKIMWETDTTPMEELSRRAVFTENNAGYMRIVLDMENAHQTLRSIAVRTVVTLAGGMVLSIVLAWFFAGLLVGRLSAMIRSAQRVAEENNLAIEFSARGRDEVGTLGRTLNSMMSGLRKGEEMRSQIVAAEVVQRKLLPESLSSAYENSVYLSGFYKAMSGVGGDYYDMIPINDEEFAICMGDVSSHGVGSSLVMSNFSAQLKLLISLKVSEIRKIFSVLNSRLFSTTPEEMFITFFIGIYNVKTKVLKYGTAGHTDSSILRADGKREIIPGEGIPMGMDENDFFLKNFVSGEVAFHSGDTLLLYTDGANEAMNAQRELFGTERLYNAFAANHLQSPAAILEKIALDIEQFTGRKILGAGESQLNDDIAMLLMKIR